jgi:hypothetical protein
MSISGNNILYLIDDDPECASAKGIKFLVAWAMVMRAEGHMPDQIMTVFNRLFSEYWKTSPPRSLARSTSESVFWQGNEQRSTQQFFLDKREHSRGDNLR